jgi:hypothetical protein
MSMNIFKRLDDLLWYNNKYIHKIEDTFYTFLTKQEIYDFYNYLSNNPCDKCINKLDIEKIEDKHPTLWKYSGCNCNYFRIALSNTYRENYKL